MYFSATGDGNNTTFDGATQHIIVDSSGPDTPTFSKYSTSKTIVVSKWKSYDYMSNTYTTVNPGSGISGIKSYTVALKKNNSTVSSKSYGATGGDSHTFSSLLPYTAYALSVTAVDMAGNTKSASETVTTSPAKVTDLSVGNVTYTSAKLNWKASAGATSYDVYMSYNGTYTKVNSSPVTTVWYTATGLSPASQYEFYVISKGSSGEGDRSEKVSATTVALPQIDGDKVICSGTNTYTINGLLSGYSILWSNSSHLLRSSSQGSNPCNFNVKSNGSAWIKATISDEYSTTVVLDTLYVWIGKPLATELHLNDEHIFLGVELNAGVYNTIRAEQFHDYPDYIHKPDMGITDYDYDYDFPQGFWVVQGAGTDWIGFNVPWNFEYAEVPLTIENTCGTDMFEVEMFSFGGGYYSMSMSPNPSTAETTISIKNTAIVQDEILYTSEDKSTIAFDDNEEWEYAVYTRDNRLKTKKAKLRGKSHRINTSGWKPGIYIVRAKYRNKLVTGKLIVK